MRRIDKLFLDYPFYGSRQMVRHLCGGSASEWVDTGCGVWCV